MAIPVEIVDWLAFNKKKVVDLNSIHLFKVQIDKQFELIKQIYKNTLSEDELAKSERFQNVESKITYVVGKYFSRKLLSIFLKNSRAKELEFSKIYNNKPSLNDLEFNISHSKNILLIAVSQSPVGVDVEFINQAFEIESIIDVCFNPNECNFINYATNQHFAFYTLWTRKESLLKATGEGLIDNLNQLNLLSTPIYRKNNNYNVKSISINKNYVASLAFLEKAECNINYWSV